MNFFKRIISRMDKKNHCYSKLDSNDLKSLCCIYKKLSDKSRELSCVNNTLALRTQKGTDVVLFYIKSNDPKRCNDCIELKIGDYLNAICEFDNNGNVTLYKDSMDNREIYKYDENNELRECNINGTINTFYTEGLPYIKSKVRVKGYSILSKDDIKVVQKIQDEFHNDRETFYGVKKSIIDEKLENFNNKDKYKVRADLIDEVENKYITRADRFCSDIYKYFENKFKTEFNHNIRPLSLVEKVDCNDIIQDILKQLDDKNNVKYKESLVKSYVLDRTITFSLSFDKLVFKWMFDENEIITDLFSGPKRFTEKFLSYFRHIYKTLSFYYGFKCKEEDLKEMFANAIDCYGEDSIGKIYKHKLSHLHEDLDCVLFGNGNNIEIRFKNFEKANEFFKYVKDLSSIK